LFGLSISTSIVAVARTIKMRVKDSPNEMADCKCPICKGKMVDLSLAPSPLDNIVCPKCRYKGISFSIPLSLGSVVVDCRCDACGCKWSVRVDLPKNLFGKNACMHG